MKKKTASTPAAPVEIMPPISFSVFPPQPRTVVSHLDVIVGTLFHWVCLLLSLVCFGVCIGIVTGACLIAVPGLALFGIGWFLQRTGNRTR